jgi:adenylate cyclase
LTVVKRTGDGAIVEFRSVVDAVRCAIEVQSGMVERDAGLPPERSIEFRVGIHLGDVVEEADGDLMGDGVNIAGRLEGVCAPGAICLSEDAYRQVSGRLLANSGQAAKRRVAAAPGACPSPPLATDESAGLPAPVWRVTLSSIIAAPDRRSRFRSALDRLSSPRGA